VRSLTRTLQTRAPARFDGSKNSNGDSVPAVTLMNGVHCLLVASDDAEELLHLQWRARFPPSGFVTAVMRPRTSGSRFEYLAVKRQSSPPGEQMMALVA
jgi:hypothetical protein